MDAEAMLAMRQRVGVYARKSAGDTRTCQRAQSRRDESAMHVTHPVLKRVLSSTKSTVRPPPSRLQVYLRGSVEKCDGHTCDLVRGNSHQR